MVGPSTICTTNNPICKVSILFTTNSIQKHIYYVQGDVGDPLVRYTEDGKVELVGLESFGSKRECDTRFPIGFIRTAFYWKWIQEITGIQLNKSHFNLHYVINADLIHNNLF